jgi:phospholipid transport system substrate-binding protein
MLTRRSLLLSSLAAGAMLALAGATPFAGAWAADSGAAAFIEQTGKDLTGVVNGSEPTAQKQIALQKVIDRTVDVDAVARFCLGRYWRTATPDQQQQYLQLFHRVLLKNITGKLGEFKGVTFTMGRSAPREGDTGVATVVTRPNSPPSNVEWIVSNASGSPRIVDVVAEGTSLRLTQRSDYASYLSHNNSNVGALLQAMKQQVQAG